MNSGRQSIIRWCSTSSPSLGQAHYDGRLRQVREDRGAALLRVTRDIEKQLTPRRSRRRSTQMMCAARGKNAVFASGLRAGNGLLKECSIWSRTRASHISGYRDTKTLTAIEYYSSAGRSRRAADPSCRPMLATAIRRSPRSTG